MFILFRSNANNDFTVDVLQTSSHDPLKDLCFRLDICLTSSDQKLIPLITSGPRTHQLHNFSSQKHWEHHRLKRGRDPQGVLVLKNETRTFAAGQKTAQNWPSCRRKTRSRSLRHCGPSPSAPTPSQKSSCGHRFAPGNTSIDRGELRRSTMFVYVVCFFLQNTTFIYILW